MSIVIDGLVNYWRFCDTNRSAVAKKHFEYRPVNIISYNYLIILFITGLA